MPKKRAPLSHYAKSITAFFAPTLTQLGVLLSQAKNGQSIDWTGFGYDAAIYLLTAIVVWAVPNKPPA